MSKEKNNDLEKMVEQFNRIIAQFTENINQNIDDIERLSEEIRMVADRVNENSELLAKLTTVVKQDASIPEEPTSLIGVLEKRILKTVDDIETRMRKLETKYLEIPEDELEPDMPAVLDVLNSRLAELEKKEKAYQKKNGKDYKTKEYMMTLIEEWYDILRTCVKYMCMSGYKTDLLDEQMGKVVKLQSYIEKEESMKSEKKKDNPMFA